MQNLTYSEGGKYYAVIWSARGYNYYHGPFNCRSSAYRFAKNCVHQGRDFELNGTPDCDRKNRRWNQQQRNR